VSEPVSLIDSPYQALYEPFQRRDRRSHSRFGPARMGRRGDMKGYTVITSDEKNAGHVVEEHDDYVVVEHGTLRKSRHPLPRTFVHADDAEQVVRATVPSSVLHGSPEVGDDEAIARHYGLAEPDPD